MNTIAMQMNELITQIARSLVDSPQDVRVNAIDGNYTTVLEIIE